MAKFKDSFCKTPQEQIASPPKGYKGTGTHTFDGEPGYKKRDGGLAPEVTYDQNVSFKGETNPGYKNSDK